MKKIKKITAFLLAVLLIFTFAACKKDNTENNDQGAFVEEAELTAEELKTAWEGVYEGAKGVVVIRDAVDGKLHFTVSMDGTSLSGTAVIDGYSAEFSDADRSILLAVSDNKLLVESESNKEGAFAEENFLEIFTRNDEDPYSFVIMYQDETVPSESDRFDMTATITYTDPKGRFTVSMPDIFDDAPEEAQPEDGIYMQTSDGSVYIMTEAAKKNVSTEQELVDYLDGLGILAAIRPDGMVVYSQRFTDGTNDPWVEFSFMRILSDTIVKVSFVCADQYYDECSAGASTISIDRIGN